MELSVTEEGYSGEVMSSPSIPKEFRGPLVQAIGTHLGKLVIKPQMPDHKVAQLRKFVDRVFVRGVKLQPYHSGGKLVLLPG